MKGYIKLYVFLSSPEGGKITGTDSFLGRNCKPRGKNSPY